MSSADTNPDKHIFPFFRLPGELRDNIYDSCDDSNPPQIYDILDLENPHKGMNVKFEGGLLTNLLLVSKKFAVEYKNRKEGHSRLVVTDRFASEDGLEYIGDAENLPPIAQDVASVEFRLNSSTAGISEGVQWYLRWMQGMLKNKAPNISLDRVSVIIYMLNGYNQGPACLQDLWS